MSLRDTMPDGMVAYVDVFRTLIDGLSLSQSSSAFIVDMKGYGFEFETGNRCEDIREDLAYPKGFAIPDTCCDVLCFCGAVGNTGLFTAFPMNGKPIPGN